jgi:hypothetical protein
MYKKLEVLFVFILLSFVGRSQVITVKQDGSGDVTNIQQGVDLAQDGDTVLVWPGIYFENVLCRNKNITIASLMLTTSDKSYMYQTKIDGNFTGSCLKIEDCMTGVVVCGFTMEHGSGSNHGSPGGGGISIENVQVIFLKDCLVQNNKVKGHGGGIYIETANAHLAGITICANQAYGTGGGIFALSSPIDFDSLDLCNIYLNYAPQGTDIYKLSFGDPIHLVLDTFTVANPDYYYLFSYAGWGYPGDDITYQINAGKIEGVSQDLYVAPWGDNANNGLDPGEPLKEISYALLKMQSDSVSPDTIHLANGIYAPSTGEKFPLSLKAYVSIRGESRDSTILDGDNEFWILNGIVYADHYQINDLTIRNGSSLYNTNLYGSIYLLENNNSSFSNLLFTGNHGTISSCGNIMNSNNFSLHNVEFTENYGGSALSISHGNSDTLFYDTVTLYNCHFKNNQPEYITPDEAFGGALTFIGEAYGPYSDLITGYIYNCVFNDNFTKDYPFGAGDISIGLGFGAHVSAINCTFGFNNSENVEGANIGVTYNSDLSVYNSIMYGNYPTEFYMYAADGDDCSLSIHNSLVAGGEEGIRILSPWNNLYYDQTNIDTDPVWDTTGPWPYSLLEGSPCIDAGTLDLPPGIVLPETDITGNPRVWGNSVDMGAYEYGPWVKVPDRKDILPEKDSRQLMAYPNPFHHQTDIYYKNLQKGRMKIQVFDLQGVVLNTLADIQTVSGQGTFSWNGTTTTGIRLSAGVYILQLSVNDVVKESLKVILE